MDVAHQIGETPLIAKAILRKGTPHDYFNKFDSAEFYYRQSLRYSQVQHDSVGIANALFSLAILVQMQGNNIEAIDQYLEVEKMFKALHDEQRLSRLYNNLGSIYRKTEQYDAAIQVYENSLAIKERLNDSKGILNTSINLSMLYTYSGQFKIAASLATKSLEMARQLDRKVDEISSLISLGVVYSKDVNTENKDLKLALQYLLSADKLLSESSPIKLRAECWTNLAGTYQALGSNSATATILKKLDLIFEKLSPEAKISYYEIKVNEQLVNGNYKGAFSFLKLQTEAQNNLIGKRLKEKAQELEVRYETEKKEGQITQLELDKQVATLELITRANQRNLLIAVAIGLLIIIGLVLYQFRQKQQSNLLLSEKNVTIERSLKERETLLKEIHHRVKNNLQIISSLLSLQSKSTSDVATQGAISESRNRVKSMSLIHEQLYQEDTISGVEMKDYITRLVGSLTSSYGLDTEKVEVKIEADNILLDVDSAIPLGLIINELVSNAMKYAFPEQKAGTILISLHSLMEELRLVVQDNGVGMDDSKKSHHSFGLSMVNSLMRKLKAEMNIVSNAGTSVELIIKDFKKVTFG
jgi:two-component sensor histidine kinase